jgi:hypothetical protein
MQISVNLAWPSFQMPCAVALRYILVMRLSESLLNSSSSDGHYPNSHNVTPQIAQVAKSLACIRNLPKDHYLATPPPHIPFNITSPRRA